MGEMQVFGDGALRLEEDVRVDQDGRGARAVRMRTAGWLFVCCLLAHGSGAPAWSQARNPLRLKVSGTTNTQAVLSYTAPDSGACTVKVSQQASLTPLVHDVDPALFPGSDQDTRPEAITAQTSRVFVVGKRLTQQAADGKTYSRALETYALHYYHVACGSVVMSGTFTTANIPLGMTYNDVPQVDAGNPGQWMIPTPLQDRTQTIADPQTGALLKRVSIDPDKQGSGSNGLFTSYGGFVRNCPNKLQTAPDGSHGYLCIFTQLDQGYGTLYYIIPATGEVRKLGMIYSGSANIDDDMNMASSDGANTYRSEYNGDFTAQATASFAPPVLYSSVPTGTLMHDYDSSFDPTMFNCSGAVAPAGGYVLINCLRGVQDSYGWLGVLYGGDGRVIAPGCTGGDACPRIVAAMNVTAAPETRWCMLHSIQQIPNNPLASLNFQLGHFAATYNSGNFGSAPLATHLTSAIGAGQASITVDGDPKSLDPTDTYAQSAAVGDVFYIGQSAADTITITGISSGSILHVDGDPRRRPRTVNQKIWNVTHSTATAFSAGEVVWAGCKAGFFLTYWKFLNDPHGQDTTNTNVVVDSYWDGGGHDDDGPLGRVTEYGSGWAAVYGTVIDHLNQPLSLVIDDSPGFAGVHGLDYGSTTSKHPSYQQDATQTPASEQRWFMDMMPFDGGNLFSPNPGATLVSGQLYKYILVPGAPLGRKQVATIASSGGFSLLDISGPGSLISDQPADAYKYCVANVAGECRAGSQPGDIFINAPKVQYLYCTGGDGPNPGNLDLCFGNAGTWAQGMAQVYLGTTSPDSVAHSRIVTHGLAGIKDMFYYSTAKSLPNASWALFNVGVEGVTTVNVWMAKIPPLAAQDTVDRSTFVRSPILITPPLGQHIASATIEFGYSEQGDAGQHYCTSRRETCVAVSATVNDAMPFYYAQTETYTRMPCAKSCSITLPVLPAHVAFYQVKFYDAQGVLVGPGDRGVSVEAGAVKPGGIPANAIQ